MLSVLHGTREISVTQLPIETIVALAGKSNPTFDLQTDIFFGGNGGAKLKKFLDCLKSIVIGRNLIIDTPHVFAYR